MQTKIETIRLIESTDKKLFNAKLALLYMTCTNNIYMHTYIFICIVYAYLTCIYIYIYVNIYI